MKYGDELVFNKKIFTFEKLLGKGGTGETILVKDTTTDMLFAIKKFVPYDERVRDDLYIRFVDEIKILFLVTHPNVIRVYNYYLYPEKQTGFIQMEYVSGVNIKDHFMLFDNNFEEIFIQIVNGFNHLERNGIIHRDIRPENILITNDGVAKIIDFGFGKKLDKNVNAAHSIILNWPVSELPDEVAKYHEYNHQSEIYFVGKLFKKVIDDGNASSFKFGPIIEKMIQINPENRYQSFEEIIGDISAGTFIELNFTGHEKIIYRKFANCLLQSISRLHSEFEPHYDIPIILSKLEDVLRTSMLEEFIQDNAKLISCFVRGGCSYFARKTIELISVQDFYHMLKSKSESSQRVILDNLYARFSNIPVGKEDDLPF